MITVVIPYFQRSKGVLRRALASIAAQRNCPLPLHIVVVDDASPVPTHDEIAAVTFTPNTTLQVIKQSNGGPGAARNAGLDAAPPKTRYIAFLDSDDEWSSEHLARAVESLEQGYDFYFADLYQLDQTIGAFARAGRIKLEDHDLLETRSPDLYAYRGNLFDQVLRGNIIGTPTVVYCWRTFSEMRFQTEFQSAGEDYIFWMSLATQGAKPAFSTHIETTCGKGVNIYTGASWGTNEYLRRVHEEIKFRLLVRHLFPLNDLQRSHIKADIDRLRLAFVRDLVHRVRHRQNLPPNLLYAHAKVDPMTFLSFPLTLAKILMQR